MYLGHFSSLGRNVNVLVFFAYSNFPVDKHSYLRRQSCENRNLINKATVQGLRIKPGSFSYLESFAKKCRTCAK